MFIFNILDLFNCGQLFVGFKEEQLKQKELDSIYDKWNRK